MGGAQLQLIQTQPNGFSGQAYTAIVSTAVIGTTPVAEASRTGETVFATYEVVDSDPAAIETATIPVAYAMSFGVGTALTGNIGVYTTFAPLSSMESAANDSEPVPRFASLSTFGVNSPPPIAGDFDGNGVPDRVWVNDSTSQVTVHYAGYAGVDLQTFNWLSTSMMPTWHLVGVADFNGDGIPDLVWQDEVTREVLVNYYGVVPAASYWLQSAPVPGWTAVAVVDFDGQGSPALVWQEDSTRRVTIHYYEGIEYQGWNWLQSTSVPGWHVVGMADFNRDGVPDLVWQSDTTGQVTVHYYGGPFGSVFQGWRWLNNAAAPPGWTVKAVSDVNGDGVPDLLWQNTTTHQVTVHYYGGLGGASMIGWNWISEAGIPGWSIIH